MLLSTCSRRAHTWTRFETPPSHWPMVERTHLLWSLAPIEAIFIPQLWIPLGWIGVLTGCQTISVACLGVSAPQVPCGTGPPGFLGPPEPGSLGLRSLVPELKIPPTFSLAFLVVKQIALAFLVGTHVFWMSKMSNGKCQPSKRWTHVKQY